MRRTLRRGFSLLEVMVALAVLAASLMAVAELSGSALRNYSYGRDLSVATLLARGKMAELEEKYEDSGFTEFDQMEEGTFADQGQPGMRWKLDVRRPTSDLSAEKILTAFLGGGDGEGNSDLLGQLIGKSAGAGGGQGPGQGTPGGLLGGVLQGQVTALAEEIKKGVRQVTLRVSWKDGKTENSFDVPTFWVVLNPRAPGNSRGPNPDMPPGVASPAAAAAAAAAAAPQQQRQPVDPRAARRTTGGTQ